MNLYEVTALVEWPGQGEVTDSREEMAVTKMDAITQVFDKVHDAGGKVKGFPTVKFISEVGVTRA